MPWWVTVLIAGIVSIGVVVGGKAIVFGLTFSRRPLRDPGRGSDIPSASPQAQIPSNSGTGAADGSDSTERPMTLATPDNPFDTRT
jgi:hypothetical protein